jgi:RNA 3'-terminal phosphate cyclase (ATP)
MITLDGSQGEGGGQILRTALALSLVTRQPFRIERIRAGRSKPGLLRQHLACVQAAKAVGSAQVEGDSLGSSELVFHPGDIVTGRHEVRIGSAGSTLLVLQTVLPPLMLAGGSSELRLEGGTHNPFAPPFPFIDEAFLPLVCRMGFDVEGMLENPGFFPNGGGRCTFWIRPAKATVPLELPTRSSAPVLSASVCLSALPDTVAERELAVLRRRLGLSEDVCRTDAVRTPMGPGNSVHVRAGMEGYTEVFSAFGSPGVRAEEVAGAVLEDAVSFLDSGAAVGPYLADQLLLPMALGRGGSFVTGELSGHTRTNIEIIGKFIDAGIACDALDRNLWRIRVAGMKEKV